MAPNFVVSDSFGSGAHPPDDVRIVGMNGKSRVSRRKRGARDGAGDPGKGASRPSARTEILNGFLLGMLLASLLATFSLWLESTGFGHRLGWFVYEEVHRRLEPTDVPVVVVDVTNIPVDAGEDGVPVTSRTALAVIVEATARSGAKAIGVDVDLSPEDTPGGDHRDVEFLDRMLAVRRGSVGVPGVPVFLGVHRAREAGPKDWLSQARYSDMAAHMLVTESRQPMVPTWVRAQGHDQPLWGMSSQLARVALGGVLPKERTGLRKLWRANVARTMEEGNLRVTDIFLDCSAIDRFFGERISLTRPPAGEPADRWFADQIAAPDVSSKLRGKLVLIGAGDPDDRRDGFFVPARSRIYSGVYLHACGVFTILRGYLYEMTTAGRVLADLGLALLVFGAVAIIRLIWLRRRAKDPNSLWLLGTLLFLGALLAFTVGYLLVNNLRIVWDGFVYVALAAGLHFLIELYVHGRHQHAAAHGGTP